MDKSWVWLPRNSVEYEQGATKFVFDSARSLGNVSDMFCPCVDCRNLVHQSNEIVLEHLVIRGMELKCKRNKCWSKNGDIRNDSTADGSVGRVQIYDYWKGGDELIAQGMLLSTDPEELANDIPLGPNAAIVKVQLVVKPGAYLWRPSPEISLMADALNETTAWPIDRLDMPDQPAVDESTRKSPESGSPSTGSSGKGAKQKCVMLDIDNTGQRVALGRVFSTDPAEKVYFVPLGPNASKVWVEISKVDDVRVWRTNFEVEFIADAVGTTVAWPNEKIIFL